MCFPLLRLYTVMNLKKPFIFLKSLPEKLNKFYNKNYNLKLVINNKSKTTKIFNPVTNFDVKFEELIRSLIARNFPNDSIIGEEFKRKNLSKNYLWSIDPIDGTKAFVVGVPTWSNLIGLVYKNKSIIGLANFPELNRYYLNDEKNSYLFKKNKKIFIKSSKRNNLKKIKVIINLHGKNNHKKQNYLSKKLNQSVNVLKIDALSYCLLAEGKVEAVIESNLKPYDIVPLIAIIKNSGGHITDWNNKSAVKGGNILATANKNLHQKLLKIVKKIA